MDVYIYSRAAETVDRIVVFYAPDAVHFSTLSTQRPKTTNHRNALLPDTWSKIELSPRFFIYLFIWASYTYRFGGSGDRLFASLRLGFLASRSPPSAESKTFFSGRILRRTDRRSKAARTTNAESRRTVRTSSPTITDGSVKTIIVSDVRFDRQTDIFKTILPHKNIVTV